jgi:hypothetical protein
MNKLTDHLTPDKPFGPEDAANVTDPYCRRMLFQAQNKIYHKLRSHPPLIVGRKGSGKTAFLQNTKREAPFTFAFDINSATAFANIIRLVQRMAGGAYFVEPIARLWDISLWIALFAYLSKGSVKELPLEIFRSLTSYLETLGVHSKGGIAEMVQAALTYYERSNLDCPAESLPDYLEHARFDGTSFDSLKSAVLQWMGDSNIHALVVVDSLDQYDLQRDEVGRSVSGMLMCLGSFGKDNRNYHVRFCLPSELYDHFLHLSTNPAKDIVNHVALQWHAAELLCIAAHRLGMYLKEHAEHSLFYNTRVAPLDLSRKKDATTVFNEIFGASLQNTLGHEEDTISYIMRHTQLLPRHLLVMLNHIASVNRELGGTMQRIDDKAIRGGIARVQDSICAEVFSAFRYSYPNAQKVCEECIPDLPIEFDHSALQLVFNRVGKKAMGGDDFVDFIDMLVDLGIIGRVMGETDRYVKAMFAYTLNYRLPLSSSDRMCLHPIFSQRYNARTTDALRHKVIYPFGSDTEEIEYR